VKNRVGESWHYLKEKTTDYIVIPAKAGIQGLKKHRPIGRFWMPAFAGMTAILSVEALRQRHGALAPYHGHITRLAELVKQHQ